MPEVETISIPLNTMLNTTQALQILIQIIATKNVSEQEQTRLRYVTKLMEDAVMLYDRVG